MKTDIAAELERYLKMIDKLYLGNGINHKLAYPSMASLVLAHGTLWSADEKTFRGRRMTIKQCFKNAANMVIQNNNLVYCEGYAYASDLPIAVEHAWVLQDGNVIDPTLRPRPGVNYVYYGIQIKYDYLAKQLVKNRVYGILDNAQEIYRGLDVSEWKSKP